MQQAKRWRRRRPAAWQVVLARWLLALAVIVTLSPSVNGPSAVARAQDRTADDVLVGRARDDEDARPEHQAPDDGAPIPTPTRTVQSSGPVFAPPPVVAPPPRAVAPVPDDQQPRATDATSDTEKPRTEKAHAGESSGTRKQAARARAKHAPTSCTAEQGATNGASFGRDDRLVLTYYYYWYDQASLDDPALSQHPPADPPLDWRSVAWHERQLTDMASAGIDVALAVYWGDTSAWSTEALTPMVQARENLLDGLRPPAIGLFFDTNMYATILPERPELSDFTTEDGLDTLAHQVGVFLDHVPPCHRARVDGRPLVFFWRSDTEDGDRFIFDDRTFAGLTDRIEADYGERLHPVLEHSWRVAAQKANVELGAVDFYRWGAALNGPRFEGRTTAIGPGYDDRNIEGRPGYTRERVDGATYSRDLRLAVLSGSPWLLLETWNEVWEGTAIAETEETGRAYLGITARYTALFHQLGNERARDGWFDLGSGHNAYLRRLADAPIEQGMPANEGGRWGARPLREDDDGTGYFHFAIDRRLDLTESQPLSVQVEYFDVGEGSFTLEYDSIPAQPAAPADVIEARPETRKAVGDGAPKVAQTVGDGASQSAPAGEDGTAQAAATPVDGETQAATTPVDDGASRPPAPIVDGVYKAAESVPLTNTGTWRTHRFDLPDASLRSRQYDGGGDFQIHDLPGDDQQLHAFGRVTVTAQPATRPVLTEPENLAFVDPTPRQAITLRWSEAEPSIGYLVVVQPFGASPDADQHGFTTEDRQRCTGEAQVEQDQETRGLARRTTCDLRLAPDLEEGVYRWRVRALDANGNPRGEPSDWGFFVVARR